MVAADDLGKIKLLLADLGFGNNNAGKKGEGCKNKNPQNGSNNGNGSTNGGCINLSPPQLFIIGGFIAGDLEVNSVLVNKNQDIEIVLVGTLRRGTQLEKIMEQVGNYLLTRLSKKYWKITCNPMACFDEILYNPSIIALHNWDFIQDVLIK